MRSVGPPALEQTLDPLCGFFPGESNGLGGMSPNPELLNHHENFTCVVAGGSGDLTGLKRKKRRGKRRREEEVAAAVLASQAMPTTRVESSQEWLFVVGTESFCVRFLQEACGKTVTWDS